MNRRLSSGSIGPTRSVTQVESAIREAEAKLDRLLKQAKWKAEELKRLGHEVAISSQMEGEIADAEMYAADAHDIKDAGTLSTLDDELRRGLIRAHTVYLDVEMQLQHDTHEIHHLRHHISDLEHLLKLCESEGTLFTQAVRHSLYEFAAGIDQHHPLPEEVAEPHPPAR